MSALAGLDAASIGFGTPTAAAAAPQLIDFAARQIPAQHIRAAGYSGVVNYVSLSRPGSSFGAKPITRPYAESLTAAGLVIVSNYQYGKPGGTAPSDFTRGFAGGVADARTACQLHTAAGGGHSAPIFFTIDEDINRNAWNTVALQWFRGINAVLGVQRTGVYGGIDVCQWATADGVIGNSSTPGRRWAWQTRAWSGDQIHPAAVLYQRVVSTASNPGPLVGGLEVDVSVAAWLTAIAVVLLSWAAAAVLVIFAVATHWRYPAIVVASCLTRLRIALTGYSGVVAHLMLAAAAATVALTAGVISVRLARSWLRMRARAHRHCEAVRLVGRRTDAAGVVVLDVADRAAYCVLGRPPAIVVTSAARAALDEDELAAVLAHERAHLAGHHNTVVAALRSLAAVFPGLPLMSQAPGEVARLLEMRADDAAARKHGRAPLLSGLLALFGATPAAEGLAATQVAVLTRAQRLAAPPAARVAARARAALIVAVIALGAGPVLSALGAAFGVLTYCLDPLRKGDRPMMMWYGGNWGWGGWALMAVGMVVFWALLITAIVLVVRYLVSSGGSGGSPPIAPRTTDDVLAERYARGEIDDDEYRRRLALLHQNR